MNKSINQIRVELSKIVTGDNPVANVKTGHLQLYSFFWGDFLRAYKENTLNYPVMGAFYPNGSLLRNQTQVQLNLYIADKLYKDWSNLNDIESDTLQICRDVFNIINHSTRWNQIGRVQSCSVSKFIQKGGDEVAGHEMTIQFLIRDSSSICGLPMVDYDFDQVVGDGCSPVQIYEDGVLVDTVASGGIYEYSHGDAHYVITNSVGGILYSGDIAENDTLTQAITDSVATLKDTAGATISTTNILAQGSQDIEAPDGSVAVNGNAYDTVVSGGTLEIPVVNSVADPVGTIIVGGLLVANTQIEVNSVNEGSIPSEQTLDIQLTDGTNPVVPDSVVLVGDVLTIEVPESVPLTDYTCSELINDTSQSQQVCLRNYNFFSKPDEIPGTLFLPSISYGGDYSIATPKVVYNSNWDKYFVFARAASAQIRIFDGDWNPLNGSNPISPLLGTDIISLGDYFYCSNNNTVNNLSRVNADNYSITNFSRTGRGAGMVAVGTDIYMSRGATANTEPKLVKFDTIAETFTTTNSAGDAQACLDVTPAYDGTNIIAHVSTGSITVNFYSISGDSQAANVVMPTNNGTKRNISSIHFIGGAWWIVCRGEIVKINASTYAIDATYTFAVGISTGMQSRQIVYNDRYIITGSWFDDTFGVFDTVTGRGYKTHYPAIPFIATNGSVGGFGIDMLTYPLQQQGVFIFEDFAI